MDEAIKQIGERLKGLREVLNIPAEEIAELCEISLDHYLKIESGEADPSVYRLSKISKRYGIDLDVHLYRDPPAGYGGPRGSTGPVDLRRSCDRAFTGKCAGNAGYRPPVTGERSRRNPGLDKPVFL